MSDVFTPHLKIIEQKCTIRALLPTPAAGALGTPPATIAQTEKCSFSYLPTLEDLYAPLQLQPSPSSPSSSSPSHDEKKKAATTDTTPTTTGPGSAVLVFRGGESEALRRVDEWMWRDDNLRNYFEIRNGMLGERYSSKLSPWLALGCISPRFVVAEARRYEAERVSNKSTYWLVWELCCRDFFHFQCYKYGSRVFLIGGARGVHREWSRDEDKLSRWKNGYTGVPIVDANMRELKATGWMSNRGRQIVASYFIFELELDWRLGADHFESLLLDHDVYSNWGNWNAMAGLTGGRINRFNMTKQSRDYDPQGEYLRHWLPELRLMTAPQIFEPWLVSTTELTRCGVTIVSSESTTASTTSANGGNNSLLNLTPYPSPIATSKHISSFSHDTNRDTASTSKSSNSNSRKPTTNNTGSSQRKQSIHTGRPGAAVAGSETLGNSISANGQSKEQQQQQQSGENNDNKTRRRGNKVQHY
jgi:deoxyribodipyrimidine photo-lyase